MGQNHGCMQTCLRGVAVIPGQPRNHNYIAYIQCIYSDLAIIDLGYIAVSSRDFYGLAVTNISLLGESTNSLLYIIRVYMPYTLHKTGPLKKRKILHSLSM